MKVLIIDNYDSFTYNLAYLVRSVTGKQPEVKRNDCFEMQEVQGYDKLLLSPGPGVPSEAGRMMELLEEYSSTKSILGICLGHQAIASCYGATLTNMVRVVHGRATMVKQVGRDSLFDAVPEEFNAGRYHSWVVDRARLPECLEVTAEDEKGMVMALRHRSHDVKGLQFHPESVMTPEGKQIISNWLKN